MKMQDEEKKERREETSQEKEVSIQSDRAGEAAIIIAGERDEQVENNEGDKGRTAPKKEEAEVGEG